MTDRPLILDYPSSTQAQALQALPDLPIVEALPKNRRRKNEEVEERQQNIQRLATAPLSRAVRAFHNALDMAGFLFYFCCFGQVVNVNDNLSGHI